MKTGIGTPSGPIGGNFSQVSVWLQPQALCGYGQSSVSHYVELIQENIKTSQFVPASVMAAIRSQEYGYSLL